MCDICHTQPVTPPPDALREAEAVDTAWHDEGDHIEYHAELPERLLALRAALRAQGVVQSPDSDV
jgi:hypothetical protein